MSMDPVFISICIPAYKRVEYLKRLLDSISVQQFRDYEVIVTDDSPGTEVENLCGSFSHRIKIIYLRNPVPLGSPANWNQSIRMAQGKWIKIMHDDDWFASPDSLLRFANWARDSDCDFLFSAFNNVHLDTEKVEPYALSRFDLQLLKSSPLNLLKRNFIGHPSTTLIKNGLDQWFDERLKWVVDIEFYIRVLSAGTRYAYIPEQLVNIGVGKEQVTYTAFRNPEIEIPEQVMLLEKLGNKALKKMWAYDYYWRFIRNLGVRDLEKVRKYYPEGPVPQLLKHMVKQQRLIPVSWLKIGFVSKISMGLTYFWNRVKGRMQ